MNKPIEEMADILCSAKEHNCNGGNDCLCIKQATALYNAGYTQKINDDEVVVSKEEYERLQIELKSFQITDMLKEAYISQLKEELKQANKETAREILQTIKSYDGWNELQRLRDDIAETYGVEVE